MKSPPRARALLFSAACAALRRIYSSLDSGPILDLRRFPNAQLYEDTFVQLAQEAKEIFAFVEQVPTFGETMLEQEYLSSYGGKQWRLFIAKSYGHFTSKAANLAPNLYRLMLRTPEVISAAYSWIPGGKIIPKHTGPFRGVMRFVLPLVVPEANGTHQKVIMMIDKEEIKLMEGRGFLFDDTFVHSAENSTSLPRIVLLLDIPRDRLSFPLRCISRFIIWIAFMVSRWKFD